MCGWKRNGKNGRPFVPGHSGLSGAGMLHRSDGEDKVSLPGNDGRGGVRSPARWPPDAPMQQRRKDRWWDRNNPAFPHRPGRRNTGFHAPAPRNTDARESGRGVKAEYLPVAQLEAIPIFQKPSGSVLINLVSVRIKTGRKGERHGSDFAVRPPGTGGTFPAKALPAGGPTGPGTRYSRRCDPNGHGSEPL